MKDTWQKLTKESLQKKDLKQLFLIPQRHNKYLKKEASILFDFSRQLIDDETLTLLFSLSRKTKALEKFNDMTKGAMANKSEKRMALHCLCRDSSSNSLIRIKQKINEQMQKIKIFCKDVKDATITGADGKTFKNIVVVGIGGSHLGIEFCAKALEQFAQKGMEIFFLSGIDEKNFSDIKKQIKAEESLFIVISKSYTTFETLANEKKILSLLKDENLEAKNHIALICGENQLPEAIEKNYLEVFHIFDFIGGRYSVSSAVGALPLSLYIGYDNFLLFLKGAEEIDIATKNNKEEDNIALISALIDIWNTNFLNYQAKAIFPYSNFLEKFPFHLRQLSMESLGKSVNNLNEYIKYRSGLIIFGELGINAQHSFMQFAHQGAGFPIDFIGIIKSPYENGKESHKDLLINLLSQAKALAFGNNSCNKETKLFGNKPSSIVLLDNLSPCSVGNLLAFYEAQVVLQAFILDVNPFDQFGVEWGKKICQYYKEKLQYKDENQISLTQDEADKFYLKLLSSI